MAWVAAGSIPGLGCGGAKQTNAQILSINLLTKYKFNFLVISLPPKKIFYQTKYIYTLYYSSITGKQTKTLRVKELFPRVLQNEDLEKILTIWIYHFKNNTLSSFKMVKSYLFLLKITPTMNKKLKRKLQLQCS